MVPPTSLAWFFVRVRGRSQTSWWTIATTLIRLRVPDNRANPLMPSTVSRVQSDWLPTSVMVPANSPVTLMSSSTSGVEWPIASATNSAAATRKKTNGTTNKKTRNATAPARIGPATCESCSYERNATSMMAGARPAGLGL